MSKSERGLHELYRDDPFRADALVFNRRRLLGGLGRVSLLLGAQVVFAPLFPRGLIPAAWADSDEAFVIQGKHGLTILNDRPLNAETPPHLLDEFATSKERLFVRNNGIAPDQVELAQWRLAVGGESAEKSRSFSLNDLKSLEQISLQLTLECGGNGRAEFDPPVAGNQWTLGAVGCPQWNGVRLRDVLEIVGVKPDAVYLGYYGADGHLSRDPGKSAISRGVPIRKAMEAESMLVWGMNNEPLHPMNGYPLRMVFGGWPGSVSGKWVNRIVLRNRVHDGAKMSGKSYRVPRFPVAPGVNVNDRDMAIIESMPVKSLITFPRNGLRHAFDTDLVVRGHAWAGDHAVSRLELSIDFGQSWHAAALKKPVNRLAWQHFESSLRFPQPGYYEVWARATDSRGIAQPMVLPGWNPKGYLNNACHRVAVYAV